MKKLWIILLVALPLLGAECPMNNAMMPVDGMGNDNGNDNSSPITDGSSVEGDWPQEARLAAFDPGPEEFFGESVAISGSVAVVGGSVKDSLAGVVDVFNKYRGVWELTNRLTRGPARFPEQGFGSSVAANNDYVFVGAHKFSIEGTAHIQRGAVYVYRIQGGGTYEQLQLLTVPDGEDFEQLGTSMALESDQGHLIVGAVGRDRYAGAAYLYRDNGGTFSQTARLTASDSVDNDDFGQTVAMSNVWAAVGAPGKDFGTGAVYVFERQGLDWIELQKITAADGEQTDQFGGAVAMFGDLLAISSPTKKRPGDELLMAGAVYIYRRVAGRYEFEEKLVPDDSQAGLFGRSLAVRNDRVLVGIFGGPGLVQVFEQTNGAWEVSATIRGGVGATVNRIGNAMGISEDALIVGGNDVTVEGRPRGGAGFVFTTPDAPMPPDLPPGVRF